MNLSVQQIALIEATINLCGGYQNIRAYLDHTNAEISVIWSVEDVIAQANQRHIPMTYDKAYDILKEIKRNHDANVGINWDVIDCYLNHSED